MKLIAPSILSADFSNLSQQIRYVEIGGADWIHCDIMDGHFVPNITFGPFIVKAVKQTTSLFVDAHLMIENPDLYIDEFVKSGVDLITVHQEAVIHLHRTIQKIKEAGIKAGVSINPATPFSTLYEIAEFVDLILIMSVNPGFGGQKFIESQLRKIKEADEFRRKNNLKLWKKIPLTPEEKQKRNKERMLAILGGALLGISFPPVPFPFTILIFFGFVPYFFALENREKLIDINRLTYLFAFIFNAFTIYWVGGWGAQTDPFLMIGGALLVFLNPIFFLIPSTLYYFAKKSFGKNIALILLPFFWVTYEYLYMVTDAAFPWLTLGNGLSKFLSFIQIADLIGTLGLSMITIFINIFLYKTLKIYLNEKKINFIYSSIALILLAVPVVYGIFKLNNFEISKQKLKVGLIQPNLNPWEKWEYQEDLNSLLQNYFTLSKKAIDKGAKLIIWPETALPVYLRSATNRDLMDSIYNFVDRNKIYLLTGMPDFIYFNDKTQAPPDAKFSEVFKSFYATYNAVLLFSPNTKKIEQYGKMKLVPFGERVPFVSYLPFLGDWIKWNVGLSGWNVGQNKILFNVVEKSKYKIQDTIKINSLVCFESVFPSFVADFTDKGSQLITVVTNDSWYGNSSGPYQHKEIGVLRAVENRRTVLRAANGGISTIIDPLGRTLIESKMYERTFIVGNAPIQNGLTFYSRFPLLIPILSIIITILILLMFLYKRFLIRKI